MAAPEALRLGTRGSRLALAQSGQIARRVEGLGVRVDLVVIRTSGDRLADVSLAKVGGKGLFLKELEEALAAGEVDFAVHSLKDVPAELPAGFALAAIPARADVRDVVITAAHAGAAAGAAAESRAARVTGTRRDDGVAAIRGLPPGARVATGSLRRRAQLRSLRPDLDVVAMRGNVDTRIEKLRGGVADAILLAAAGLDRLGVAIDGAALDADSFLPAPGQGALALEVRDGDRAVADRLAALHDRATAAACDAERAFLRALGASCQVPVAAWGRPAADGSLVVDGLVASLDGREVLRDRAAGAIDAASELGARLAERLAARGARDLLASAEREAGAL